MRVVRGSVGGRRRWLTVMTVDMPQMMKVMTVSWSLAVGIPACTPESLAGQGACSLNSLPHPAGGEGSLVSRWRDFHIKGQQQ